MGAVPSADTEGYPKHAPADETWVNTSSLPMSINDDEPGSDARDPATRCSPGVATHPKDVEAVPEERVENGRRNSNSNASGSSWAKTPVISSAHSDSGFAGRAVKKRSTLASMVCVVT